MLLGLCKGDKRTRENGSWLYSIVIPKVARYNDIVTKYCVDDTELDIYLCNVTVKICIPSSFEKISNKNDKKEEIYKQGMFLVTVI